MQLKVGNVYTSYADKSRRPSRLGIRRSTVKGRHSAICLFPALRLIVAPIPVHMGAQLYGVIQRVSPRSEAQHMGGGGRSNGTGLIARPVDVCGVTPRATASSPRTSAGLYIPDAAFSTGILRPYNRAKRQPSYKPK